MLVLSPDVLAAAYEYLKTTDPFRKWNLPEPDDVRFRVIRDRAVYGWHRRDGKQHTIAISSAMIGHTTTLLETMAHELVHVHEEIVCPPRKSEHSAAFRKWAEQVCRVHGFDARRF